MVGIWSEFGRNDSESESNLGVLSLTSHSYQIPTIPTIPLGFRSEFGRIRSECVGESKVLVLGLRRIGTRPGRVPHSGYDILLAEGRQGREDSEGANTVESSLGQHDEIPA